MATRTEHADYTDKTKSGGPIFNVWTPIAAAVLSIILAIVVVARAL